MGLTETAFFISPAGRTNAATIRQILANTYASRIELKPQTPFSDVDCEFETTYTEMIAGTKGNWLTANTANATTIDSHSTYKSGLAITGNANSTNWNGSTVSGPFVYEALSGTFDVMIPLCFGDWRPNNGQGIVAQSTSASTSYVYIKAYMASSQTFTLEFRSTTTGTNTSTTTVNLAAKLPGNGYQYLVALKRAASNVFSSFYSTDFGKTWTQIGTNQTRNDFSSDQNLGMTTITANTNNTSIGIFDWFRNRFPYDTTSPVSTLVIDSGAPGTIWTPSTFQSWDSPYFDDFGMRATAGYGSIKHRMSAGESNPPSLAGSALTEAGVQALSPITGRYLQHEATLISANGYELASWAGATMNRTLRYGGPKVGGGRLIAA